VQGATIISMIPGKALNFFCVMILVGACFAADAWVARQDGIGPVKIGMTLPQLNMALHEKFAMPGAKAQSMQKYSWDGRQDLFLDYNFDGQQRSTYRFATTFIPSGQAIPPTTVSH
jgi:Trehalase